MGVVHCKRSSYDVLIDRSSPWGNPFVLDRDGDRATVIAKYENWARNSEDPSAKWIRDNVQTLTGKMLACWCAPKACHGDVLLRMAEEFNDLDALTADSEAHWLSVIEAQPDA